MQGGVGRYTYNLTKELRKIGFDVHVACNHLGSGDFSGLSPTNTENSDVLLKIVDKIKPDLVHIQYEHGLYGLKLDPINPTRTSTNIDSFYKFCKIPIVTTFHSAYTFKQWLNLIVATKDLPKRNIVSRYSNNFIRHWKRFINYYSFHNLNRESWQEVKQASCSRNICQRWSVDEHKSYSMVLNLLSPIIKQRRRRQGSYSRFLKTVE